MFNFNDNGEKDKDNANNNNELNNELNNGLNKGLNDASNNELNDNKVVLDISSSNSRPLSPIKSKTRSPFKINRTSSSSNAN